VPPPLIEFSNVATDEGGNTLSGVVSITFSLYNAQRAGEPLWTETQANVPLDATGREACGSLGENSSSYPTYGAKSRAARGGAYRNFPRPTIGKGTRKRTFGPVSASQPPWKMLSRL